MQCRPRKPHKAEDATSNAEAANNLRNLQSHFFHLHHNNIYSKEALEISSQLLEINPEFYTAWNYRKLAIESILKSESDSSSFKALLDDELKVLLEQKAHGCASKEKIIAEEFELVHQALFTDPDDQSRNIESCASSPHTFSILKNVVNTGILPIILYFNRVVEGINSSTVTVESCNKNEDLIWRPLSMKNSGKSCSWVTFMKIPDLKCNVSKAYSVEVSLGHTQDIISSSGTQYCNPYRFRFTLNLWPIDSEQTERESDMKMLVWKDENFSSSNIYSHGASLLSALFDQMRLTKGQLPVSKWNSETLMNEMALFRELLSEMNCKIAKLTLARLLMAHDEMMSYGTLPMHKWIHSEEVLVLLGDLMRLDPVHFQYYKDKHSLVLMEQVTSSRDSLVKHCFYYTELTSSFHKDVCLRLNNLSLSQIGFVERLLWVQMLDLSHNELRSVEGLEAMQLLTYLNLSNNRFSSFTAFDPLRLITSLKILDISYNEIGTHSVDTTRYLCSSPLSHTMGSNWNAEDCAPDNVEMVNYWEAVFIFKDLHLTQLDAVGNIMNDNNFRKLMLKTIPSLEFLDGAYVR